MKPSVPPPLDPCASLYILETTKAGADRLDFQHGVYLPEAEHHLEQGGLTPLLARGKTVYDIGCGSGAMTQLLAEIVGPEGHVYALDISAEQLGHTKRRLCQAGFTNITFIQADVSDALFKERHTLPCADFVYLRFILAHIPAPHVVLENIKGILAQGGTVLSHEAIIRTAGLRGPQVRTAQPLQFHTNTLFKLAEERGLDFDLGERLDKLYAAAGFEVIEFYRQPKLTSATNAKKLWRLSFQEWRQKALDTHLITPQEAKVWQQTLDAFPEDKSTIYNMGDQAYVVARLPTSPPSS